MGSPDSHPCQSLPGQVLLPAEAETALSQGNRKGGKVRREDKESREDLEPWWMDILFSLFLPVVLGILSMEIAGAQEAVWEPNGPSQGGQGL